MKGERERKSERAKERESVCMKKRGRERERKADIERRRERCGLPGLIGSSGK